MEEVKNFSGYVNAVLDYLKTTGVKWFKDDDCIFSEELDDYNTYIGGTFEFITWQYLNVSNNIISISHPACFYILNTPRKDPIYDVTFDDVQWFMSILSVPPLFVYRKRKPCLITKAEDYSTIIYNYKIPGIINDSLAGNPVSFLQIPLISIPLTRIDSKQIFPSYRPTLDAASSKMFIILKQPMLKYPIPIQWVEVLDKSKKPLVGFYNRSHVDIESLKGRLGKFYGENFNFQSTPGNKNLLVSLDNTYELYCNLWRRVRVSKIRVTLRNKTTCDNVINLILQTVFGKDLKTDDYL